MPTRAMRTSERSLAVFRRAILRWFAVHGRAHLPWRTTRNPWKVLVSELMLQQTQVDRVIPKFVAFVRRWSTPAALARAPLGEVLAAWSGLGYNRRAKFLHDAAKAVVSRHGGRTPVDVASLEALPGIGRYTARAVASFSANADVSLWDTNVRRIALRYFYGGEFARRVPADDVLEALLDAALPRSKSRDWHGALMDFGSAVCLGRAPKCGACPLRRSCVAAPKFLSGKVAVARLVRPQPTFKGSRREARGIVLRTLAERGALHVSAVQDLLSREDGSTILSGLEKEGMIVRKGASYRLP